MKNNSSRDEMCEKNKRIHLDRSYNKQTDFERNKYNPVFDKIKTYRRNWLQHMNRNPRNRLTRIVKTTEQQAEENRGDLYTDF